MNTHILKFDRPLSDVAVHGDSLGNSSEHIDSAIESVAAPDMAEELEKASLDAARVEALLERIGSAIENLNIQSDDLAKEARAFAIRLAASIVKNVFGNSDEAKFQRLEHLLSGVMNHSEPIVRVFVNDVDKSKLESSEAVSDSAFPIELDESVQAGECRIEFSTHELVSDLESQLIGIEQNLLDVVDEF